MRSLWGESGYKRPFQLMGSDTSAVQKKAMLGAGFTKEELVSNVDQITMLKKSDQAIFEASVRNMKKKCKALYDEAVMELGLVDTTDKNLFVDESTAKAYARMSESQHMLKSLREKQTVKFFNCLRHSRDSWDFKVPQAVLEPDESVHVHYKVTERRYNGVTYTHPLKVFNKNTHPESYRKLESVSTAEGVSDTLKESYDEFTRQAADTSLCASFLNKIHEFLVSVKQESQQDPFSGTAMDVIEQFNVSEGSIMAPDCELPDNMLVLNGKYNLKDPSIMTRKTLEDIKGNMLPVGAKESPDFYSIFHAVGKKFLLFVRTVAPNNYNAPALKNNKTSGFLGKILSQSSARWIEFTIHHNDEHNTTWEYTFTIRTYPSNPALRQPCKVFPFFGYSQTKTDGDYRDDDYSVRWMTPYILDLNDTDTGSRRHVLGEFETMCLGLLVSEHALVKKFETEDSLSDSTLQPLKQSDCNVSYTGKGDGDWALWCMQAKTKVYGVAVYYPSNPYQARMQAQHRITNGTRNGSESQWSSTEASSAHHQHHQGHSSGHFGGTSGVHNDEKWRAPFFWSRGRDGRKIEKTSERGFQMLNWFFKQHNLEDIDYMEGDYKMTAAYSPGQRMYTFYRVDMLYHCSVFPEIPVDGTRWIFYDSDSQPMFSGRGRFPWSEDFDLDPDGDDDGYDLSVDDTPEEFDLDDGDLPPYTSADWIKGHYKEYEKNIREEGAETYWYKKEATGNIPAIHIERQSIPLTHHYVSTFYVERADKKTMDLATCKGSANNPFERSGWSDIPNHIPDSVSSDEYDAMVKHAAAQREANSNGSNVPDISYDESDNTAQAWPLGREFTVEETDLGESATDGSWIPGTYTQLKNDRFTRTFVKKSEYRGMKIYAEATVDFNSELDDKPVDRVDFGIMEQGEFRLHARTYPDPDGHFFKEWTEVDNIADTSNSDDTRAEGVPPPAEETFTISGDMLRKNRFVPKEIMGTYTFEKYRKGMRLVTSMLYVNDSNNVKCNKRVTAGGVTYWDFRKDDVLIASLKGYDIDAAVWNPLPWTPKHEMEFMFFSDDKIADGIQGRYELQETQNVEESDSKEWTYVLENSSPLIQCHIQEKMVTGQLTYSWKFYKTEGAQNTLLVEGTGKNPLKITLKSQKNKPANFQPEPMETPSTTTRTPTNNTESKDIKISPTAKGASSAFKHMLPLQPRKLKSKAIAPYEPSRDQGLSLVMRELANIRQALNSANLSGGVGKVLPRHNSTGQLSGGGVIGRHNSTARPQSAGPIKVFNPASSSDPRRIRVISAETQGPHRIKVMNTNTAEPRRIRIINTQPEQPRRIRILNPETPEPLRIKILNPGTSEPARIKLENSSAVQPKLIKLSATSKKPQLIKLNTNPSTPTLTGLVKLSAPSFPPSLSAVPVKPHLSALPVNPHLSAVPVQPHLNGRIIPAPTPFSRGNSRGMQHVHFTPGKSARAPPLKH